MPHAYDPWSHHKHHAPVEEETEEETEAEVTEEEVEPCESGVTQLTVDFSTPFTVDYEETYSASFGEVVVGSKIGILGPVGPEEAFRWNEPAAFGAFTL